MKIFNNLSILNRLIFAFGLIFIIYTSYSVYIINQINALGENTKKIHEHPLYVSNAAIKANRDITKMHRTMKDVVLSNSEEELKSYYQEVNDNEFKVISELDIVKERIIGEEGKNLENEVRQLFIDWKPIRDEVITLTKNGQVNKAIAITKGKGYEHVKLLESKMINLNKYARNKANYFLSSAEKTQKNLHYTIFWSVIGITIISIIIILMLTFSIIGEIKPIQDSMIQASRSGDLKKIQYKGNNEITDMAKSYNILVEKLLEKEKTLTSAYNELEKAHIKLKKSEVHKNKFLTTMSHELRTPLNAILGYSQLLKQKYPGELNDQQVEYITIILNSADHLLALINDILDIAIIDADSMILDFENISIKEFMEETISFMRPQFEEKGVSLTYQIEPEVDTFSTDHKRCKQIILNLLSNALKYTSKGGKVNISVKKENNNIIFKVIDTGIGIKKEDLDKVFTEFYQSDQTRDQAMGGTGIGLALCKRLSEILNGHIYVNSKENEGSTFTFQLPLKQVQDCNL